MKRAFVLAVTACLILSILSGTAYTLSGGDIAGTWRLASVVINDSNYTPEEAGLQIVIVMVMNVENKALFLQAGKESELMSWSITDDFIITLSNDTDEYLLNYENGNLILKEDDDFYLIFERENVNTKTITDSPVNTDAVIGDFIGSWTAVYIEVNGLFVRLEDFGAEMKLEITESAIVSHERFGEDEGVNTASCVMNGYSLQTFNSDGTTQLLKLHENGMIALLLFGNTVWLKNDKTIDDPEVWICASCGHEGNTGKFCTECGRPKPNGAPVTYKCSNCGWEPEDSQSPPKFCPDCGDAFDENDVVK